MHQQSGSSNPSTQSQQNEIVDTDIVVKRHQIPLKQIQTVTLFYN
jgi:hypothetical protein